jgi:hypothetical protein
VTLGRQLHRPDLPNAGARWCEATLPERSIYRLLATQRERLFPPALFADLFQPTGRRSVPPSILAVVTVLVDLRARLRASADPDRIFRVTTDLARGGSCST